MADHSFIDKPEQLERLADQLNGQEVIGVDTEADSFFHYFDKLCLIQISSECGIHLIDPLALPEEGLAPLAPVLASPLTRVIFHAADYDLYVLQRHGGLRVRNLFDTMVSAQLLGYPGVGLGALVERHFGVKLSKDQQRTDWSRRPLRGVQEQYAASDVRYLAELTTILEGELREKNRLSWAQDEFELLEEREWPERKFDKEGYLRIKAAKKLSPRALAVLRELFLMRDRRARKLDRPPFKVLGNGTLLELAQSAPSSRRALGRLKGITDLVLRRMGHEILEAVSRGTEGPEHKPPTPRRQLGGRRRLDRRGEVRLELLKRWRAGRAKDLSMDPGVLCPNALLEQIAWANPQKLEDLKSVESLRGWRLEELQGDLLEVIQAEQTARGPESPTPTRGSRKSRGPGDRRGSRRNSM